MRQVDWLSALLPVITHARARALPLENAGASTNNNTIAAITNTRVRSHSDAATAACGVTDRKLGRPREQSPSQSHAHAPSDTAHAADGSKVRDSLGCREFFPPLVALLGCSPLRIQAPKRNVSLNPASLKSRGKFWNFHTCILPSTYTQNHGAPMSFDEPPTFSPAECRRSDPRQCAFGSSPTGI